MRIEVESSASGVDIVGIDERAAQVVRDWLRSTPGGRRLAREYEVRL